MLHFTGFFKKCLLLSWPHFCLFRRHFVVLTPVLLFLQLQSLHCTKLQSFQSLEGVSTIFFQFMCELMKKTEKLEGKLQDAPFFADIYDS